ncbi:alpha/beta-hydrolase [Auriscalpium vulgare]|uniref:Alpha/beta-hydrolase n=1 Tax=Auriscalpium vulgare TaxID=40419 RepID=A0ACB8SA19_9AGAM|nr:alpha/beta-hydrolase [Auriscalpium vulgare]
MSQYAYLSEVDPEYAAFRAANPTPDPDYSSVVDLKKRWIDLVQPNFAALYKARMRPDAKYSVADHKVPVDGGEIVVRVVIPETDDPKQTFPVLTWFYGGGWVFGNIDQDDWLLRVYSTELQVVTVNVEYRSAPEHTFPSPWDDGFAAVKWVASNAASISVSLDKGFIIGGMSAGGNLAATIAHLARDDPFFSDKPLTGSYLAIPAIVHGDAYPEKFKDQLLSMEQNKDAPNINRDFVRFCWDTVKASPEDPKMSPLLYPSHAGLPPTYFQICGLDILRDEGLLYERELRDVGNRTKLDVYPGLPHGFQVFSPTVSAAAKYEADTLVGLKWLLAGAK